MTSSQRTLHRPEGRIAYDIANETADGPLVVLVPGMGDLRSTYRHLVPLLADDGLRVVATDLRGHGGSDATFGAYGDVPTADDLAALLDELRSPAVLVGSSMGAAAATYLAAERPDLVRGLVLLGPFVRDPRTSAAQRLLLRLALARPWVARVWRSYHSHLFVGRRPDDHDAQLDRVAASLRRPGHARAFARTARAGHAAVAARLGEVDAPTVVVMGAQDPDFPDPAAEADWVAGRLRGSAVLVPDAGHYPQAQRPDLVAEQVVTLARRVGTGA